MPMTLSNAFCKCSSVVSGTDSSPFRSPVIVGCIAAIEKNFFTEIGEYDEGMEKWGGENLDLPIRVSGALQGWGVGPCH